MLPHGAPEFVFREDVSEFGETFGELNSRRLGVTCLAAAFKLRQVPLNIARCNQRGASFFRPIEHHISRVPTMSHDHEYLLL